MIVNLTMYNNKTLIKTNIRANLMIVNLTMYNNKTLIKTNRKG